MSGNSVIKWKEIRMKVPVYLSLELPILEAHLLPRHSVFRNFFANCIHRFLPLLDFAFAFFDKTYNALVIGHFFYARPEH